MISEFWQDRKAIMSSFTLLGDKVMYAYLVGVSQEGYTALSVELPWD